MILRVRYLVADALSVGAGVLDLLSYLVEPEDKVYVPSEDWLTRDMIEFRNSNRPTDDPRYQRGAH